MLKTDEINGMSFEVKFWQIVFKVLWLLGTLKPAVKIQTLVTKPD